MSERPEHVSASVGETPDQTEIRLLKAEVASLNDEIIRLQKAITDLRSSAVFRLRQKLLPENSPIQRLYLAFRTGKSPKLNQPDKVEYSLWWRRWGALTDDDRKTIKAQIGGMTFPPKISIVMPVYNPPAALLEAAIRSVREQLYPFWELCIADDASTEAHVRTILDRVAKEEARIKVVYREHNGRIAASSNDALALATGKYVAFLDHDDLLAEHALYMVAKTLEGSPDAKLIYTDEDKVDSRGAHSTPHFKPDWNSLLLLSYNYMSHLSVYEAERGRSLGWLRQGVDGAQDWDFALRFTEGLGDEEIVHIPHVLYHWRIHEGSTAKVESVKPYVAASQLKAVKDAIERRDEQAIATRIERWGVVRTAFLVKAPAPLVSVIIPTRDRVSVLAKCLTTLFETTVFPRYEIIVLDNGSVEAASLSYFASLSQKPNVRIIRVDAPFNYSALNNQGVSESQGEILALLNNDIEIVEPYWMDRLTAHAQRDGIGAVGPRLLYPNGQVQHGGIIVGFDSGANHFHLGIGKDDQGYMGRAIVDQYASGVTGACLFVKRESYEKVGGLDEQLAVSFNDVDLCLKLQDSGLRNVYAGSVTCIHHESASRGLDDTPEKMARATFEAARLRARWTKELVEDRHYNPNLASEKITFALAETPRIQAPWR